MLIQLEDFPQHSLERPIVLTGGSFDLFHLGHAEFLKQCKSYGKTLVVQLASDKYVQSKKGPKRPILNEVERATLLSYLRFVDYVFISDARCESKEVIEVIKPDILVLSDENKEEKENYLKQSLGKAPDTIQVVFVPAKTDFNRVSTSSLIEKIKAL